MSKMTGLYVGAAVGGLLLMIWIAKGQSVDAVFDYANANWGTVLLAGQIIALFIMAILRRYVASGFLLFTTVLTVMGVLA